MGPLGVILLLGLLREPLLQPLLPSLNLMGGLHSPHGTHQVSSHLQLTLLLVEAHCQVLQVLLF